MQKKSYSKVQIEIETWPLLTPLKSFLFISNSTHRWARWGVCGVCTPPKNLKSPDTPPCQRQGGCAPHGVGHGAEKNVSPPGVGGGKKVSCAEIFFGHTPCVHTPLVPKPMPTYVCARELINAVKT